MGESWPPRKHRTTIVTKWAKQRGIRLDIARVSKVARNTNVKIMAVRDNIVDIAFTSGSYNSVSNSEASGTVVENVTGRLGIGIFIAEECDM